MQKLFTPIAVAFCIASTTPVLAQVLSYDHHSTDDGDRRAAEAEYMIGLGIYARNYAFAMETAIRAQREQVLLAQEVARYRYGLARIKEESRQRKVNARQELAEKRQRDFVAAARRMLADARAGGVNWPKLLLTEAYRQHAEQVEGILAQCRNNRAPVNDCVALHSLAKQMEAILRANVEEASFTDRCAAMRCVRQIEYLAQYGIEDGAGLALN